MRSHLAASAAIVFVALAAPAFAADFPVTVKSCNRAVTFDAPPTRAVSHDINLTEMMLALGLRDRMVGYTGVSGWKTLDERLRQGVGELPELAEKEPTKEVLLGVDADFLFAGWNYGLKVGGELTPETLAPLGVKVYELTESCIHIMARERSSMQDMYDDLLALGAIFGVPDRAEALVAGYKAALAPIESRVADKETVKVFVYDSGEDQVFTAGRYAIPTAMIEAAGGRNIVDDVASSWVRIGWETVVERNPDVVVIVDYGDVSAEDKIAFMKANPAFAAIPAVKNDRFVVLPYVEATPGPRNIEAIERLAKAFHPEAM